MKKKSVRAAIYARVSTTAGQSPQMQLDVLREYAEQSGMEVVAEHVDAGVSGTKERRPELSDLMNAVRKRRVDVVLVYRFDRFARSVRHLISALEEFDQLGVGLSPTQRTWTRPRLWAELCSRSSARWVSWSAA
tara:strand:- start:459 stop:860 length:402 start_codon:yes stop_codon:yes gene_type:complete